MNHQERMELLGALSRAGVTYYKSHDLELKFGADPVARELAPIDPPKPQLPSPIQPPVQENVDATKKLTELIETLKMDDASLLDKMFPAGAGG
jgi:hypothetical protein